MTSGSVEKPWKDSFYPPVTTLRLKSLFIKTENVGREALGDVRQTFDVKKFMVERTIIWENSTRNLLSVLFDNSRPTIVHPSLTSVSTVTVCRSKDV